MGLVYRCHRGAGDVTHEDVSDPMIVSEAMAASRGKRILDDSGQGGFYLKREYTQKVPHKTAMAIPTAWASETVSKLELADQELKIATYRIYGVPEGCEAEVGLESYHDTNQAAKPMGMGGPPLTEVLVDFEVDHFVWYDCENDGSGSGSGAGGIEPNGMLYLKDTSPGGQDITGWAWTVTSDTDLTSEVQAPAFVVYEGYVTVALDVINADGITGSMQKRIACHCDNIPAPFSYVDTFNAPDGYIPDDILWGFNGSYYFDLVNETLLLKADRDYGYLFAERDALPRENFIYSIYYQTIFDTENIADNDYVSVTVYVAFGSNWGYIKYEKKYDAGGGVYEENIITNFEGNSSTTPVPGLDNSSIVILRDGKHLTFMIGGNTVLESTHEENDKAGSAYPRSSRSNKDFSNIAFEQISYYNLDAMTPVTQGVATPP